MPVSAMAMEEAWDILLIRKAIRKQYEDEDEIDPVELGDYGLYDTEAEQPEDEDYRETPWVQQFSDWRGRDNEIEEPLHDLHHAPPWIGRDTYVPLEHLEEFAPSGAGATTPASGKVAVEPRHQEKAGDEDDEDAGVAPAPKP